MPRAVAITQRMMTDAVNTRGGCSRMAVSPLTLSWSRLALGLKHDTMESGPENNMVEDICSF